MPYQHQTSGAAYSEVLPNINFKQRAVLEAIQELNKYHAVNDRQIGEFLSWPINTVTPRRGELVDKGLIFEATQAKDPVTGRKTSFWKISARQLNLF